MAETNVRIRQFYNQKPINIIEYTTLEIFHPSMDALRFVRAYTDQTLTLEATAPRDAGLPVVFKALNFTASDPDQGESPDVRIKIELGRVGSEAKAELKKIREFGFYYPAEVIYRKYLSDDTSAPVTVFKLYADNPVIQANNVTLTATDDNPNKQDVSDLYTFEIFPGLESL